jgi:hypothetical protein
MGLYNSFDPAHWQFALGRDRVGPAPAFSVERRTIRYGPCGVKGSSHPFCMQYVTCITSCLQRGSARRRLPGNLSSSAIVEVLCLIYKIGTSPAVCPEVTTRARQRDAPYAPQVISISVRKQTQSPPSSKSLWPAESSSSLPSRT